MEFKRGQRVVCVEDLAGARRALDLQTPVESGVRLPKLGAVHVIAAVEDFEAGRSGLCLLLEGLPYAWDAAAFREA